ncbi:MAG: DNA translocase FtsK [Clostridia bacterium]|nr:DNA translocase FtsK [Clostridia bacterium]
MAGKTGTKGGKSKKRKVSGKRGTASRKRQGAADPRGVIGIAVLCVGLLALACQFIPSSGGFLSQCMLAVRGLGGTLCLLLPLVVCWAGVVLVFFAERKMSARPVVCIALIFLFVEALLQLFQADAVLQALFADGTPQSFWSFVLRSYRSASLDCKGGGLIGALLAYPLYVALDVWGGVVVLIAATLIALMFLTGVSFGHVGMAFSQWLDELRIARRERREEREALRAAEEERELERESELAEQRQQKRRERESAQLEREQRKAQALRQAESAAQEETPGEPELPKAKRKGRPKLEVVRPQEPTQPEPAAEEIPEPPLQTPARPPRKAPRARAQGRPIRAGEGELYIERDEEFARLGIDERSDPRERRRRPAFTIEEAEDAFLHGMNAVTYSGYGAQDTRQEQSAYAVSARPEQDALRQDGNECSAGAAQDAGQPDQEAAGDQAEWDRNEPEAADGDGAQNAQAAAPEEQDAWTPDVWNPNTGNPDARPADEAKGQPAPYLTQDEPGGSVPSSIPAAWQGRAAQEAPARRPEAPQNVLAAQERQADGTIVQLRGSRLDGTPLVMPAKDAHEAPKAMEEAYAYPPIDLLNRSGCQQDPNQRAKDEAGAKKLLETLESFGVQAKLTHVTHGPAITRYELQPAPGVKVSRIVNLVDDIALNMASDGVRIEAPIPGKPAVGIEIPNERIETVSLRDVLESPEMTREKSPTAVALGKGISGAPVVADMAKMPHVLIAGATGSGKSVCINTIINSIIYRASPSEVRLILIDPKVVELSVYNGIPHLLVPVVTDPKKASAALSWAVVEMEHRYKRFETMGVRDIRGYNNAIGEGEEPMSKIIVIIDELADLMMVAPGEVEESICRLAQLARAAGIHLVIATQRPSVNVITGVIKANIPSRIAFAVSSQIDSRTILDAGGAEKLLGKGDMLYAPQGAGKPTRVQGCFVSDDEVQRIVDYVRKQHSADYNEDVIEQMNSAAEEEKAAAGDAPSGGEPVDEMLSKAIELAVEAGQVSISMLQRRLRVGYARAGRLVDEMTLRGITAEAEGPTKPRAVLISREEWRRMQENGE